VYGGGRCPGGWQMSLLGATCGGDRIDRGGVGGVRRSLAHKVCGWLFAVV